MVVIKGHKLVLEYAYNSTERSDINDVRSAGKSLTALLLGIAIKDGLVKDLEQDVYSFFSIDKYPNLHEDYKKVKIKHLLDMASGLDADSDDWKTPGNAGQWMDKDDWVSYLLGIPLKRQPGEKWVYADINSALIGAIIEETSGKSLNDYAKEKVFTPLGIKKYYWYTNPSNQTVASGTLYLSTLDFAKLGVLVANEGKFGNHQIVPADYIEQLIACKNFDIAELWSLWDAYGMLWYKNQGIIRGKKVDYLWASGNGGNQLIVVPEEELIVALSSTAYGQKYAHPRTRAILDKLFGAIE
ncbi:MAG: serine hydrolase [Bacteroidota bacterium]